MADNLAAFSQVERMIFDLMDGDVALTTPVFTYPPEIQTFPYISFNANVDVAEAGAHDIEQNEHTLQVDVWSQKPGSKECADIMEQVYKTVHNSDGDVTEPTNYDVPLIFFTTGSMDRDPDGKTWHGVLRFKIITGRQ